MKVTMILADVVQVAEGKLFILGGGWNICGPGPATCGIGLLIEVPWDESNRKHTFRLQLEDQDGHGVELGGSKVEFSGDLEVGRPPGATPGVALPMPLAINLQALPLPPSGRFVWRFFLNGGSRSDWTTSFSTRAAEVRDTAA